jgi:hypothetical protein
VSLDLYLYGPTRRVVCQCVGCGNDHERDDRELLYTSNCTHNLTAMFGAAGVYEILWRGDDLIAGEQVVALETGLADMRARPDFFRTFNPKNKWGDYEGALAFLSSFVAACREHPTAILSCSR